MEFRQIDRNSIFCEHCGYSVITNVKCCEVCRCVVHENCDKNARISYVKPVNGTKKKLNIQDFEFVTELGKGAYGKVLLARRKDKCEPCAIKLIKKSSILRKKRIEHIMTEKNVLMLATQSAFFTKLYSCFQNEDHLFFVMEYAKCGDLASHLKWYRTFDEQRCAFYAAEITIALQFLHQNGIIYRDLKLENVLLDHDGHCKLADFGLCKNKTEKNMVMKRFLSQQYGDVNGVFASTMCSTPGYVAPEVLQKNEYGASVDWWSLGVLIYKSLSGRSPFIAKNTCDLFNSILHDTVSFPNWISYKSVSFIQGLLTKDPLHRLGCTGLKSESQIKNHSFFKHVNWEALEQRRVRPPVRPVIKTPEGTLKFDKAFEEKATTSIEGQQNCIEDEFAEFLFHGF